MTKQEAFEEVFELVRAELDRQESLRALGKFPMTSFELATVPFAGVVVLTEEVGEVCRALNDIAPIQHTIAELTQVAAVAIGLAAGLSYDSATVQST